MPNRLLGLFLAPVMVIAWTDLHAGRLYRWVDEQGNTHYSDQIPPEHRRLEHTRFNEQGLTVDKVKAAKTPEEIAQEQELQRLRVEQQRLIEEQKAADRVLLKTFRVEDDIVMARDGKIAAVDLFIQITLSNIKRLKLKLAEMQRNAASLERAGKQIASHFIKEIEDKREALKDAYASILNREKEKTVIRAASAKDMARFRELKNLKAEERGSEDFEEKRSRLFLDNVITCASMSECDDYWSKVEPFVRKHATTPLQMLAENIIMTGPPYKNNDVSLTVSRFGDKRGGEATTVFMDLQCKDTPLGREFCEGESVRNIRAEFRRVVAMGKRPEQ